MVWEDPKLLELNSEPRAWGACDPGSSAAACHWNGSGADACWDGGGGAT